VDVEEAGLILMRRPCLRPAKFREQASWRGQVVRIVALAKNLCLPNTHREATDEPAVEFEFELARKVLEEAIRVLHSHGVMIFLSWPNHRESCSNRLKDAQRNDIIGLVQIWKGICHHRHISRFVEI
jgi:hypothetical protein